MCERARAEVLVFEHLVATSIDRAIAVIAIPVQKVLVREDFGHNVLQVLKSNLKELSLSLLVLLLSALHMPEFRKY